jgi:hypothetical protein
MQAWSRREVKCEHHRNKYEHKNRLDFLNVETHGKQRTISNSITVTKDKRNNGHQKKHQMTAPTQKTRPAPKATRKKINTAA